MSFDLGLPKDAVESLEQGLLPKGWAMTTETRGMKSCMILHSPDGRTFLTTPSWATKTITLKDEQKEVSQVFECNKVGYIKETK